MLIQLSIGSMRTAAVVQGLPLPEEILQLGIRCKESQENDQEGVGRTSKVELLASLEDIETQEVRYSAHGYKLVILCVFRLSVGVPAVEQANQDSGNRSLVL